MIPGRVRNCSRTSKTTRPAARDTALMARPEKKNTTAAPSTAPTTLFGFTRLKAFAEGVAGLVEGHPDLGVVGAEERRGGEDGRRDRDALGDRLRGVADGVEVGEDAAALLVDVPGHLGDALGVVADRPEGVHRDDDAGGGQQTAAGERDGVERGAATDEEGAVDRAADEDGGVDGRLQAERDARQDDGGRAGERAAADVAHRLAAGLGEVAGELLDGRGQDDADEHGEEAEHLRADRQVGRRRRCSAGR